MTDGRRAPELGVGSPAGRARRARRRVGVDLGARQRTGSSGWRRRSPTTSRPRLEPRGRAGRRAAAGGSTARRAVVAEAADGEHDGSRPTSSSSPPARAPRTLPSAEPDGERILTWEQVYDLDRAARAAHRGRLGRHRRGVRQRLPRARRRRSRWSPRRDRVLPGEDADAAAVLEDVFRRRGMKVLSRSRAAVGASATGDGVVVDARPTAAPSRARTACWPSARSPTPPGSGSRRPASRSTDARLHRPSTGSRARPRAGVYAAGDCTGVLMLASVAAMQGRIAMWHALGDAVAPLNLQDGVVQRLHRPRDRHGRAGRSRRRRRRRDRGARRHAAAGHQRARQDAGRAATAS